MICVIQLVSFLVFVLHGQVAVCVIQFVLFYCHAWGGLLAFPIMQYNLDLWLRPQVGNISFPTKANPFYENSLVKLYQIMVMILVVQLLGLLELLV